MHTEVPTGGGHRATGGGGLPSAAVFSTPDGVMSSYLALPGGEHFSCTLCAQTSTCFI